jgi:PAS domain-containing protein
MMRSIHRAITVASCLTSLACPANEVTDSSGADEAGADLPIAGSDGDTDDSQFEPAPGGLRRLLRHQYVGSIRYLLGDEAAAAAAPAEDYPLHGFDAIGAAELALQASAIEQCETSARAVATAAAARRERLATFVPCVNEATPDASCYAGVAAEFGRLAWRRPLTAGEVATLVRIAEDARAWGDSFAVGLEYELMALLQSPHFLYLIELGEPDVDAPERRRLTGLELAARMSFFLLGRTPDAELLAAAEAGELETEAQVRAAAAAMLRRPEARAALTNFYGELFLLRDLPTISKSAELFPQFSPALAESMAQETLHLIGEIVWEQDGDIRGLVDSEVTFVDAALAELYGLPAPDGPGFHAVALPAEQGRAGLLGQASFLARFAHPAMTSPTRRGQFIRTRLLCDIILPPPPGVDTHLPPDDPDEPQTMRDKLQKHMSDDSCAGCHRSMDPLGLTLENYDALGRFRTLDNGLPIDAAAVTDDLGAFTGARELAAVLAADPRTAACVIKNFVRGGLGHLETFGELPALDVLEDRFVADGYRVQNLLVDLVASPLFRAVAAPR